MSLHGLLEQSRQSFSEFWSMRDARERKVLIVAFVILLSILIYALLIAPALNGRKKLNKSLPLLRQQVAEIQALSKKASELSGKPVQTVADISRMAIETSLTRNKLKSQSLHLNGDYVTLRLASVSFANILSWLDDMQTTLQLFVVDTKIIAQAQPDKVDATITLRQAKKE